MLSWLINRVEDLRWLKAERSSFGYKTSLIEVLSVNRAVLNTYRRYSAMHYHVYRSSLTRQRTILWLKAEALRKQQYIQPDSEMAFASESDYQNELARFMTAQGWPLPKD